MKYHFLLSYLYLVGCVERTFRNQWNDMIVRHVIVYIEGDGVC